MFNFKSALKTLTITLFVCGLTTIANAEPESTVQPTLTAMTTSTTQINPEVALAEHLKQIGARVYVRNGCPFAAVQREFFGNQAASSIEEVNCSNHGDQCSKNNVVVSPSWEINGKIYTGIKSLRILALISGYQGSKSFSRLAEVQRGIAGLAFAR